MRNFFIADVSNKKQKKLIVAQISFVKMEIDGWNGLVFEQNNIVNALGILGFDVFEHSETSIPGIVKLAVAPSNTVNFDFSVFEDEEVADEIAEETPVEEVKIQYPDLTVSKPKGTRCDHWAQLLNNVMRHFSPQYYPDLYRDILTEASGVKKIVFHEGLVDDTLSISPVTDQLNIVLGRFLNMAEAELTTDCDLLLDIEYYPTKRLICFRKIPNCPDEVYGRAISQQIKKYLPVLLAASVEEARKLLPMDIIFKSWDGEMVQDKLKDIIERILPREIFHGAIVRVPHQHLFEPIPDDKAGRFLHINIWSAPSGNCEVETPPIMWGHRIGCADGSYLPSGLGIVIAETEGYAVAEVIGNNLYIFHDAVHKDRSDDYAILEKVLEETANIFKLSSEERLALINAPQVVIFNNSNRVGNMAKMKTETENILLPVLNKKIICHNCQGLRKMFQPINDNLFHIWLHAAPANNTLSDKVDMPDKIFGFSTNNSRYGWQYFKPIDMGVEIIDSESLFTVAELLDHNLYIYIPLGYREMSGGIDIYRRILELTVIELNKTPAEKIERDKAIKEIRRRRAMDGYVNLCQDRQERASLDLSRSITEWTKAVAALQKELVNKIRQEKEAQQKLKILKNITASDKTGFETEYNRLFDIEGVENVTAKDGKLIVHTYNIYITCKDKAGKEFTFDIGKFRIEIFLDGANGGLLFFNTTRQAAGGYNGYNINHPHVNSRGEPCLGNIQEMIAQLIAEYQFAAITSLAIQYLETVNLDDLAGSEIFKYWTAVEKTKKELAQ
ncbi:MAG: hypothetical protein Q7K65_03685 [Candidatus Buchananbacteria bacterium]|nr:hypothetical protein [Candidatus Buchananbacteria bacterium]